MSHSCVLHRLLVVLMLGNLAVQAAGCTRITEISWLETDRRMLEGIGRRPEHLTGVEGKGVIRLEHRGRRLDVPFRVRLGPQGLVQLDAEVAFGVLPGLGRLTVVSDDNGTEIYGSKSLADLAKANLRPAALRAVVLSLVGGGDLLVGWVESNGCMVGRAMNCLGLGLTLDLNRERRSVESWEISDKSGKLDLSGRVAAWGGPGELPRTIRCIVHPQELVVTTRYDQIGLADIGNPAGNFVGDTALE